MVFSSVFLQDELPRCSRNFQAIRMTANYFLGAVTSILILTPDPAFGDVCWCSEAVHAECLSCFATDCCSASAETTTKQHKSDSGSATNGSATSIVVAFAGTVGFAVLVFFIVVMVRSKRCQKSPVVESQRQLQTQPQPPSRPTNERILLIFCRRIFERRSSDISYSTHLCSCSGYIFRYSTDCCREPIWEVRTTQKPVWDMWSTRRPLWYARTTTQMPLWKRSTTRRYFGDLWTTTKQITRSTTLSSYLNFERSTRINFGDQWSTRKLITTPTTPFLYPHFWSTTPSSYTEDFATIIGASVGGVTGLAFLCCFIAACVRVNKVQRRRFQGHQAQPQPQCYPRDRGILFIVIRGMLVRRCRASADAENLISNPQVNSDIPQTTAYAYNQGPITPVAPPPYSPASQSVPPPPYSEYI